MSASNTFGFGEYLHRGAEAEIAKHKGKMMNSTPRRMECLKEIRSTQAKLKELQAELDRNEDGITRAEAAAVDLAAKIRKLVEKHTAKAAASFLAGTPPAAPPAAERKKLQKLQEELRAAEGAGPEARRRLDEAGPELAALTDRLVEATTAFKAEILREALEAGKVALDQLAEPLARMAAADQVQTKLIGTRFGLSHSGDPLRLLSGTWVANQLLDHLPQEIRPASLHSDAHQAAVELLAAEMIGTIENEGD